MHISIFLLAFSSFLGIAIVNVNARPGLVPIPQFYYTFPSTSSQTQVVRDVLGNQGTSYAYQSHDGISSSAVALSRSDNSKTLAYVPAIAPGIVAEQPFGYAHDQHHYYNHGALSVAPPALAYTTGYHSYV